MEDYDSYISNQYNNIISDIKKITLIAAPPFKEKKRIEYLKDYIQKLGYSNAEIDKEGNLIITLDGKSKQTLVFSSHADTVFSENTKLNIKEENGKIYCPGICDNSTGIVAQLYLMKYLKEKKIQPKPNIVFLFNVGEEELGNLRGVRYFFDKPENKNIKAHICIEGYGIGRLNRKFVGSHRLKVLIKCAGGHSWRDYGNPNAIIAASKLIVKLSEIILPSEPRTTFNIGTIRGGTTINSIPSEAEFTLEIRSLNEDVLLNIRKKINQELDKTISQRIEIKTENMGERPCGETTDKNLIETIKKIHKQLDIKTFDDEGSTDSNYPVSLGLPSITVGITEAHGMHSINEYIVAEPVKQGIEQLFWIFHYLDNQ